MLTFAEPPVEFKILDENGKPLLAGDEDRRFEAPWYTNIMEPTICPIQQVQAIILFMLPATIQWDLSPIEVES